MAIVMSMHWPEVSKAQYEQVRKDVGWETSVPKGARMHVAWFATDGFHVMDVWDSQNDFETFLGTRLQPSVQRAGIKGQPNVAFAECHAIFAPNPKL
jgi:hypothetical protein